MVKRITAILLFLFFIAVVVVMNFGTFDQGVQKVRQDSKDLSSQLTETEFRSKMNNYIYVSFDNMYDNPQIYKNTKIYQRGLVLKSDSDFVIVSLDRSDHSKDVKIKYDLSTLSKGMSRIEVGSSIKFFGKFNTVENYTNEKGRTITRPVINANFIQSIDS
ncbi:hypothetical protein M5C72_07535 [Companilactobacillus allii]|uniref:Uncharacterized protein n=1 Tax=Companilactobacillus allii TaxID=1847728 RepID=A0A1P8Q519_9LACO|nr:hypothetical protein [Companilactobacillus allii]APX72946.1 hypothetical protein BTM29_10445 [Companilactobacillus allii]USQ67737.1 hypothetical protein M5C72_07535 [Companilactobacillus allii]